MAKRKKRKRAVLMRLGQLSRAEFERKRVVVYSRMGDALADAGIIGWGTEERLQKGTRRAAYQAARLSLEAWSHTVAEATESRRFMQYRDKLYPIIIRKRDKKRVRGRKAVSETTVKRSNAQTAYQARVRTIRDVLGGTHAEARRSYAGEWEAWDARLSGGERVEAMAATKGPGVVYADAAALAKEDSPPPEVIELEKPTRREEIELKEAGLSLAQIRDLRRLEGLRKRAEAKFARRAKAAVKKRARRRAR